MSAKRSRQRRQDERARRASSVLARALRRACSSCGSVRIEWQDIARAREVQGSRFVDEALLFLGPDGGLETEFWQCLDCGEGGAFGGVHEGWLDTLDERGRRAAGVRPPV